MSICLEKSRTKRIGAALLTWLLTAALSLLIAVLLIDRLKLDSRWIGIAAAAVVFLSTLMASLILFYGTKSGVPWMKALLLCLVTASTLLMLGFLLNSEAVSLPGLIRILTGSLFGSFVGMMIRRTEKRRTGKGRFMKS